MYGFIFLFFFSFLNTFVDSKSKSSKDKKKSKSKPKLSNENLAMSVVSSMHEQRFRKAMELLKEAYKILNDLKIDIYNVKFSQALEKFELHLYKEARGILLLLIQKDGEKLEYLFLLGECFFYSCEFSKASIVYNKIIHVAGEQCVFWDSSKVRLIKSSSLRLIDCFLEMHKIADVKAILAKYLSIFKEETQSRQIVLFCEKYGFTDLLTESVDQ